MDGEAQQLGNGEVNIVKQKRRRCVKGDEAVHLRELNRERKGPVS